MMGGASAMSTKTHVKADMYYNKMSEKGQAILDLILFICFYAPGVFALTYAGYFYAKKLGLFMKQAGIALRKFKFILVKV